MAFAQVAVGEQEKKNTYTWKKAERKMPSPLCLYIPSHFPACFDLFRTLLRLEWRQEVKRMKQITALFLGVWLLSALSVSARAEELPPIARAVEESLAAARGPEESGEPAAEPEAEPPSPPPAPGALSTCARA